MGVGVNVVQADPGTQAAQGLDEGPKAGTEKADRGDREVRDQIDERDAFEAEAHVAVLSRGVVNGKAPAALEHA